MGTKGVYRRAQALGKGKEGRGIKQWKIRVVEGPLGAVIHQKINL